MIVKVRTAGIHPAGGRTAAVARHHANCGHADRARLRRVAQRAVHSDRRRGGEECRVAIADHLSGSDRSRSGGGVACSLSGADADPTLIAPISRIGRRNTCGTDCTASGRGHRCRSLEVGGRIVGYCAYGDARDDDAAPDRGAVYDLYVHPDVWRRGIGRQLLALRNPPSKAQGCGEATLLVVEGNMRARSFYEQAGWKPDGNRGIYEWPGFSLPVLRYRTTCC